MHIKNLAGSRSSDFTLEVIGSGPTGSMLKSNLQTCALSNLNNALINNNDKHQITIQNNLFYNIAGNGEYKGLYFLYSYIKK